MHDCFIQFLFTLSPERVRYTFTGTENGMAFDAGNRVWQIAESGDWD